MFVQMWHPCHRHSCMSAIVSLLDWTLKYAWPARLLYSKQEKLFSCVACNCPAQRIWKHRSRKLYIEVVCYFVFVCTPQSQLLHKYEIWIWFCVECIDKRTCRHWCLQFCGFDYLMPIERFWYFACRVVIWSGHAQLEELSEICSSGSCCKNRLRPHCS